MRTLLALAAVLLLSGCTPSATTTFGGDETESILFGQVTQTSLASIGLTPADNTLQTDTVANYVAAVSGGEFTPAECGDSARPLVLLRADAASTDTFYALPTLTSGTTAIDVRARRFATDDAAQAFMAAFQFANENCTDFSVTQGGTTDLVNLTVSEAAEQSKGFRLDTVAGVGNQAFTYRTYLVREGNLAISVQGAVTNETDAALIVAASAAIYAQLTRGQGK